MMNIFGSICQNISYQEIIIAQSAVWIILMKLAWSLMLRWYIMGKDWNVRNVIRSFVVSQLWKDISCQSTWICWIIHACIVGRSLYQIIACRNICEYIYTQEKNRMNVNTVVRSLITMSAERITSGKLTQEKKLKILQKAFLARL